LCVAFASDVVTDLDGTLIVVEADGTFDVDVDGILIVVEAEGTFDVGVDGTSIFDVDADGTLTVGASFFE
jgi:predicted Rdx family selenoprotein